jgi:hypothetical protein
MLMAILRVMQLLLYCYKSFLSSAPIFSQFLVHTSFKLEYTCL